jgi:hypothetical protein
MTAKAIPSRSDRPDPCRYSDRADTSGDRDAAAGFFPHSQLFPRPIAFLRHSTSFDFGSYLQSMEHTGGSVETKLSRSQLRPKLPEDDRGRLPPESFLPWRALIFPAIVEGSASVLI